jgi:hypothetical protein
LRVIGFAENTYHSAVNFIARSQMIQRSTNYPIKMAALVICQVSVLAMIVWIFHYKIISRQETIPAPRIEQGET